DLVPQSRESIAGWFENDVVTRSKATDGLSGLNAACLTAFPLSGSDRVQSKTTSGEGTAVKVSSSACTDEAGNSAAAIDSAAFKRSEERRVGKEWGSRWGPDPGGW